MKVDRFSKTKKSTFINFELFRVKEKDIPTELLEIKDPVHAFAWEPKGDRFALIHGENQNRPDISFYSMAGKQITKLSKFLLLFVMPEIPSCTFDLMQI